MGDQGNASSSTSCRGRRGPAGLGLALARLVRRRSKMLVCTTAPTAVSSRCRQYDPLSYARNFDRDGFGSALDDDVSGAGHLCHHYTFASRFVLGSSPDARRPQEAGRLAGDRAARM
uniref:Uncharacterized protein n=1 Tax=Aegilops tauschii TaxID=37682 RepID=M8C4P9_AEGTA